MRFSERLALATAALSFFISTLDTGVVNVALPQLTRVLHVNATLAAWTISAYALALSLTILPFGALADRLGVVRISGIGFVLFAVFSIGCALAPAIGWLIVFRALTGVAAAMLQATAASFVTRYVEPARRGSAFGWVSAVLSLGVALGPSVGGVIVSFTSWRWIFLAVAPFGVAGFVTNWLIRRERPLNAIDTRTEKETPRGTARIVPFAGAVALGLIFIAVFVGSAFELTREAHLSAWQVGLVLVAWPVASTIAARFAGTLLERGLGLAMMLSALALCGILACALLFTPPPQVALFTLLLFLFGFGTGTLQTPVIALSLAAFPPSAQSRAGALQRFVQNLAIAGGAALSGVLIDRAGTSSIWIFTIAVCVVAIAVIVALSYGSTRGATTASRRQASRTP
jgi:predicted MFS family arabinose efflux permease